MVHTGGSVSSYQLSLLLMEAFSVLNESPHFLVPPVLCLLGLANQRQLLLLPPPPLGLVFICAQL